MPEDRSAHRSERLHGILRSLEREARSARSARLKSIRQIVEIVHELDPIRRYTCWSIEIVRRVAARQDYKCPACGEALPPLHEKQHHVDHVVPWSLGGGNEIPNIQILHKTCNLEKGTRCNEEDLLDYLSDRLRNL